MKIIRLIATTVILTCAYMLHAQPYPAGHTQITYLQNCPLFARGIHANEVAETLSVCPNPASDAVFVKFNVKSSVAIVLSLRGLLGNVIIEKQMDTQAGTVARQLDLSAIAKGAYFITIRSETSRRMQKPIRQ